MAGIALRREEKAPDFNLPNQDGKSIYLKNARGKWVVLYFYPKDNTPGCTTESKDFSKRLQDFEHLNTIVLGISPDPIESHCRFREQHSLRVTLLSDPAHTVLKRYGVWQKKKLYGKEYWGVVRSTVLIDPTGKISRVWSPVKVQGHARSVKNVIKSMH